ncbi:hypothetical protein [Polaromonas glacialis]|uniref:hypothetical protein n=1 Tax=Polaromonas glacialis TaxID=866564 RepID=UPI0012EC513A|nr:hypothetical protein [Polaromonas glacialis]
MNRNVFDITIFLTLENEAVLENLAVQVPALNDTLLELRFAGDRCTDASRAAVDMPPTDEAPM